MRLLIVFYPFTGDIVEEREFSDDERSQSLAARVDAEQRYGRSHEVVVLSSTSREQMRRTHGRYWARELR